MKYIAKSRSKIERDSYAVKSLASLPEWPTIIALQFKNLVLGNRRALHRMMGLAPEEIVNDNRLRSGAVRVGSIEMTHVARSDQLRCALRESGMMLCSAAACAMSASISSVRRRGGNGYLGWNFIVP